MKEILERVDTEITEVLGKPWTELKRQRKTAVSQHTIIVVAKVINDPLMAKFTSQERNMLKWASLLHDISKLGRPKIKGRDYVHPFKSAALMLDIFQNHNFIPGMNNELKKA